MTDAPIPSNPSLRKRAGQPGSDKPGADAVRPRLVLYLAAALVLSGLMAVISGATLYGEHDYLVRTLTKNNPKPNLQTSQVTSIADRARTTVTSTLQPSVGQTLSKDQISSISTRVASTVGQTIPTANVADGDVKKQTDKVRDAVSGQLGDVDGALTAGGVATAASGVQKSVRDNLTDLRNGQKKHQSASEIRNQADKLPKQQLTFDIVLLVVFAGVAFAAYAGRYWGRWAVLGLFILSTFIQLPPGLYSLFGLAGNGPAGLKVFGALSAAFLLIAVVLCLLKPSVAWFNAHRPAPVAGRPARRGLFTPPPRPEAAPAPAPAEPPVEPPVEVGHVPATARPTGARSGGPRAKSRAGGDGERPRSSAKSRRAQG